MGSSIQVDRLRIVSALLAAIVLVNVGNALTIALDPRWGDGWLLLGRERNPSTWLSSVLLATAGGSAWCLGASRADRRRWNLVACLLAIMSLDEVARIHERLGRIPGQRGWVGAGLILVVLVVAHLLPWAMRLERDLRAALFAGGTAFVVGVLAMERISQWWVSGHGRDTVSWGLETAEENLEMMGVLVIINGLLRHAHKAGTELTFHFDRSNTVDRGDRHLARGR